MFCRFLTSLVPHQDDYDPSKDRYFNKSLLGTMRSIGEFQNHIGVDFKNRTLSERAKSGGVEPSLFADYHTNLQLQSVLTLLRTNNY
jgi:hypothetical protein